MLVKYCNMKTYKGNMLMLGVLVVIFLSAGCCGQQQGTLEKLVEKIITLEDKLDILNAENEINKRENQVLKEKIRQLETANEDIGFENEEIKVKLSQLEATDENIKSDMLSLMDRDTGNVFFTAILTEEFVGAGVVPFNSVLSNQGTPPGYNPSTGVFRCPQSGYYLFMVTLYQNSYSHTPGLAYLRMNWKIVAGLFIESDASSSMRTSNTMHAILLCNKDYIIDVYLLSSSAHLYPGWLSHQFSGFLISPIQ